MCSECNRGKCLLLIVFKQYICTVYILCRNFMKKLVVEIPRDNWRVWSLCWRALAWILYYKSVSHHSLNVLLFCSSKFLKYWVSVAIIYDHIYLCDAYDVCFFRYDKVLFVALQALQSSNLDLTVYHIALRELCGNFHYLISQYLYLHGHVLGRASDVITCTRSFVSLTYLFHTQFQLSHVCLLASLRVPPPDKDNSWSQGLSSRCVIDKWHIAACTRLSIVGKYNLYSSIEISIGAFFSL